MIDILYFCSSGSITIKMSIVHDNDLDSGRFKDHLEMYRTLQCFIILLPQTTSGPKYHSSNYKFINTYQRLLRDLFTLLQFLLFLSFRNLIIHIHFLDKDPKQDTIFKIERR